MKNVSSVLLFFYLHPINLFAWTNGELLIWMDPERGRASDPIVQKFETDFGVKVSCQLRRSPKVLHPAARLRSSQISTRLLKVNPDCDLRSMQRKLIEKVRVAEIIVKIPVTNLGKDVTGDLAA